MQDLDSTSSCFFLQHLHGQVFPLNRKVNDNTFGCSENSGTPNHPYFNRVFHYKPSILGYRYFWKHPFQWMKRESVWFVQGSELHLTLGIPHEMVKSTFLEGCPSSPPADAICIIFFRIFSTTMFQKCFFQKAGQYNWAMKTTLVVLDPVILGININKLSHTPPKKTTTTWDGHKKLRKSRVILPYHAVIYH